MAKNGVRTSVFGCKRLLSGGSSFAITARLPSNAYEARRNAAPLAQVFSVWLFLSRQWQWSGFAVPFENTPQCTHALFFGPLHPPAYTRAFSFRPILRCVANAVAGLLTFITEIPKHDRCIYGCAHADRQMARLKTDTMFCSHGCPALRAGVLKALVRTVTVAADKISHTLDIRSSIRENTILIHNQYS